MGTNYDPSFTQDISNQMRVPHKLAAFEDDEPIHQPVLQEKPGQPMMVPERILLAGQNQHIGMREDLKLDLDGLSTSMSGMGEQIPVGLSTPPRTLTVDEHSFPSYEETPLKQHSRQGSMHLPNGYQTPRQVHGYNQDLLATPGDGLLINEGDLDDLTLLRKHVAKLTRHVIDLNEENIRRLQRDRVLGIAFGMYIFWQCTKWLLFKSK